MILWLIGMMGTGKSTAGQSAAKGLQVDFQDTDIIVETTSEMAITNLWTEAGERAFREIEVEAVAEAARGSGIVATGGGVVMDSRNRHKISGSGPVVWLKAAPNVLAARVENGDGLRPGLSASSMNTVEYVSSLLAEREPFYDELATHQLNTDAMSPEEVASSIEDIWRA